AAVISCDAAGVGPMVTMRNVEALRPFNFGIKCLQNRITTAVIARELTAYDPEDAARVSRFIRQDAGCDPVFDQLIDIYQAVINEHQEASGPDHAAEDAALAGYFRQLTDHFRSLEVDQCEFKTLQRSRIWRVFSKYMTMKHSLKSRMRA